jgi:chromosome segregation ATPase
MAGTRDATGIAKSVLLALTLLLAAGIVGSVSMGMRAKNTAIASTVNQVQTIADRSLTLVIHPTDLASPAVGDRRSMLSDQITASVLDTSPFTSVTLWSKDGRILFSTDTGRIGNTLPGERDRISAAIAGTAQTQDVDGAFSVTVPFKLAAAGGVSSVIEMSRPDSPITSAAAPWRTNAVFLAVLLAIVVFLLIRVRRIGAMLTTHLAFAKPKPAEASAPLLPISRAHPADMQSLGLRGEAEARRRAEERATAAEEKASTMQEQYRKTLEDLQAAQQDLRAKPANTRMVPELEDRALKAEGRVRTLEAQLDALQTEREKIAGNLADALAGNKPSADSTELIRLRQVEHDAIGLRAELEGAQTEIAMAARELEGIRSQSGHAGELQEDLDAAHLQVLHSREVAETAQAELNAAQSELESTRTEIRALRNSDQRAAMLEDELLAAKAELESLTLERPAAQFEREAQLEAEFEAKVRTIREEFQNQLGSIEASYRDQLGHADVELADRVVAAEKRARDLSEEMESAKSALQSAREESAAARERLVRQAEQHATTAAEFEAMKIELAERQERFDGAGDQAKAAISKAEAVKKTLEKTRTDLLSSREQFEAQKARADELSDALAQTDREAKEAAQLAEELAVQLASAGQSNVDMNRRMQELEARRALEIAGTEGRADLDDILRVTQERLAGQTEKLIHAEERVHNLERDMASAAQRNEEVEAQLRQQSMSGAIRQLRGEGQEASENVLDVEGEASAAEGSTAAERVSSPFIKELSLDARKSLTRIMGVAQVLKHKKDAKDQAQLIKQLTAYARRLDHTVSDMAEAEELAVGTVELNVKRTDLKALVLRVVEESGVGTDHEIHLEVESLIVGVDQRRTEQILAGLLRGSEDRTPKAKKITVKLSHVDGGAMLFVEDPQPATDATLSPVVRRFAEVQGGWARVEALETGGSSFRVFLPDGGPEHAGKPAADEAQEAEKAERDLHIVVEEPWDNSGEKSLVQELHRLSELASDD